MEFELSGKYEQLHTFTVMPLLTHKKTLMRYHKMIILHYIDTI